MKTTFTLLILLLTLTAAAWSASTQAPPAAPYQKVSELVALPDFLPGMGTLYVQPTTLPVGPFLAYDRDGKLVASIYMVPLEELQKQQAFKGLAVGNGTVKQVDLSYNAGHPGVPTPHYHITVWHVDPAMAKVN